MPGAASLTVDAVNVHVHHHIAASHSELLDEALDAMAGAAHESSAHDHLVLRGILADHQQPCAAIEPAAMEHRAPFGAEVLGREHGSIGDVLHQGAERLLPVAGIECRCHQSSLALPG